MSQCQDRFLFHFGNSNAYRSHLVIPDIEKRQGVRIDYAIILGGVFKLTNKPIAGRDQRRRQEQAEYQSSRPSGSSRGRHHALQAEPCFPANTPMIMCGAVAARQLGIFERDVD